MAPFNNILADKLNAAFDAAKQDDTSGDEVVIETPEPAKPRRRVIKRGSQTKKATTVTHSRRDQTEAEGPNEIVWSQPEFAQAIAATVKEGELGDMQQTGAVMYAPFRIKGRPQRLTVQMRVEGLAVGAIAYHVTNGNHCESIDDAIADLVIPMTWKDGKPSLGDGEAVRTIDADNCDIVVVTKDGKVVQLQVSVSLRVFRDGKFKLRLQVQEIAAEQLVRTRTNIVEDLGLTFHDLGSGVALTAVPLWQHQAHPRKDWLGMANVKDFFPAVMLREVLASGRSVSLSEASRPVWNEPELAVHEDGTIDGIVDWYNAIFQGGAGYMRGADGKSYKVHWSQIKGAHAVQPGQVYRFVPGEYKGQPQAKNIRAGT